MYFCSFSNNARFCSSESPAEARKEKDQSLIEVPRERTYSPPSSLELFFDGPACSDLVGEETRPTFDGDGSVSS